MSAIDPVLSGPVAPAVGAGPRLERLRGLDPLLVGSLAVCLVLVALALLGPALAPHSPTATSILNANLGSSSEHLLGTDQLGRDLASRILAGARLSLTGPLVVVLISAGAGSTLAIAGVWVGGAFERVSVRVIDVLFAFPSLLFAILAVAVFGTGFLAPVLALSLAYTPYMARVVRSVARRERDLPYVDAGRLGGLSSWRICTRHILPNVAPVILAQATIAFGGALIDLAAISFIGLGVQPPKTEWGLMVADGTTALLNGFPRQAVSAGVMIIVTVVAFNVLGERLARRAELRR